MMWEKVGVEKNAGGLQSALDGYRGDSARSAAAACGSQRTAKAVNYEWLDAIDAVNMLDACELIMLFLA